MPLVRRKKASATNASPSLPPTGRGERKPQTAWGAWVVIAAFLVILGAFTLAVTKYREAGDVATAMGSVTGVIGALVGAYFGIRGTTVAQSQAMEAMARQLKPDGARSEGQPATATDPASAGKEEPPLHSGV
jgi:hypothetical protein